MMPVRFAKPPVIEVVCGVQFATPPGLAAAHIGAFWDTVRSEFPQIVEVMPLSATVEQSDPFALQSIEFGGLPPMRRSWLVTNDGQRLLQVQENRFLFNWKRPEPGGEYPGFDKIRPQFEDFLAKFRNTLRPLGFELTFQQFELSYINYLGLMGELDRVPLEDILVDHCRSKAAERFLPNAESFSWRTSYVMPDRMGRLHINASTALTPERKPILYLDLTARGVPPRPEQDRQAWFEMAHEWITQAFVDSTSKTLQNEIWGRT